MNRLLHPNKSLGQHWLTDSAALESIVDAAGLTPDDTVVEIGPGPGALTKLLVRRAREVIAVELDSSLARDLPGRVAAGNLRVVAQDILSFDLGTVPAPYKIVANIPYYLTSNLIRVMSEAANPPATAVILIQKEVAERVTAAPGNLSLLGVSAQFYWHVSLGQLVPAELFTPPPKVDSQVLVMRYRTEPLFAGADPAVFFRLVRAGFSSRRKKLRSSLSAGLGIQKVAAEALLEAANIDPALRAQALSLEDWYALYQAFQQSSML